MPQRKDRRDKDEDKKVELTATSDLAADTVGSFHIRKLKIYFSNTHYREKEESILIRITGKNIFLRY